MCCYKNLGFVRMNNRTNKPVFIIFPSKQILWHSWLILQQDCCLHPLVLESFRYMAFMEDMCINVRGYGLPPWLKQSRICLLMQETWVQSLGQDDPLEKGMAMHSSILSWRIPWTKEYGGLQFMGLQGFGHN